MVTVIVAVEECVHGDVKKTVKIVAIEMHVKEHVEEHVKVGVLLPQKEECNENKGNR